MLLNLEGVSRTELKTLDYGCLFVPAAKQGSHFIAGRLNDFNLLISLDGEKPFHAAEHKDWRRAAGLQVDGIRFEANTEDATPADTMDLQRGMLLLSGNQIAIVGFDRADPFPVWVIGDGKSGQEGAIGFRKWQIVRGSGVDKTVLFKGEATA